MDSPSAVHVLAFLLLVHQVAVQSPDCDYLQNVQPGQTYYVYSPGYPGNYSGGVECRWIGKCPPGYNCRIDCSEINLPLVTTACSMDRLLVSKTGNPQLVGASPYCGHGSLVAVSSGQQISIGLISSMYSPGGRFLCTLTAQMINRPECSCGLRNKRRIVGGNPTSPNAYPMMAALVRADTATVLCGATIIGRRHLLTAAHCVDGRSPRLIAAVTGMHNVNGVGQQNMKGYKISRFFVHPQFNNERKDYDIAIVQLESPIQYNEDVGPVCLPFKYLYSDFTGRNVSILGWGALMPGGPNPSMLHEVVIPVTSQESCRRQVSLLTERQICTYQPGKDACQSDSGGPVLYSEPSSSRLYHLGIISYGYSCASGYPGVHTRVTSFLNWIQTMTGESFCRI